MLIRYGIKECAKSEKATRRERSVRIDKEREESGMVGHARMNKKMDH